MKIIFKDRNLSVLFASTFLFFTNEALFLPTLPLHLSSDGYNHTKIGIVLGAFALGVLLTRPLAGYITDHKGRKISLITGVSVFLASPLLYLVSTDFLYLILVRFVHGLGISFYTTAFPAYISDASAEHERGEVFGHMATSTTLGFTLGPLAGTAVFNSYGFTALVWLCTLTGVINLVVILQISELGRRMEQTISVVYRAVVFKRSVLVSSFIQLVHAVIFGGMMTFLPLLLASVEGVSIGIFFLVQSIVIIACRILAARLADVYGRGPVFFYSFLIILCAVFLISKIDSLYLLILAAVLSGIGSALCSPSLSAFISDHTDPDARGTVFGFFYGAFDVGVIVAGAVLGIVSDLAGLREMFVITAFGGCISLILFSLLIRKGCKRSVQWTLGIKKR